MQKHQGTFMTPPWHHRALQPGESSETQKTDPEPKNKMSALSNLLVLLFPVSAHLVQQLALLSSSERFQAR